jgi:hypothetical protein
MSIRNLDKIDFVSGCIELNEFMVAEEAHYFVVRVEQYGKNIDYTKLPSIEEATAAFRSNCEKYKQQLSEGRPYIEFQLSEREDDLLEFHSDRRLPLDFYKFEAHSKTWLFDQRRTFNDRDEAIYFGRTCDGKWLTTMLGDYDIVDKAGQITPARNLQHIDWDKPPIEQLDLSMILCQKSRQAAPFL